MCHKMDGDVCSCLPLQLAELVPRLCAFALGSLPTVTRSQPGKMLRNDVWTTHLAVSVSASGLVSIVFGLVNDDPKHHVGLVHTWEHPAFNFASNPTLFVTRTTLHNSPFTTQAMCGRPAAEWCRMRLQRLISSGLCATRWMAMCAAVYYSSWLS